MYYEKRQEGIYIGGATDRGGDHWGAGGNFNPNFQFTAGEGEGGDRPCEYTFCVFGGLC